MSRSRAIAARLLRNRDLRRLLIAFLAFNAAEYATWVAILLFAYEATGPTSVGLVAVFLLAPAAILAPAASSLGDRYPRQRVLTAGYVAYGVGLGATALVMAAELPIAIVYPVTAAGSALLVIARPTQSALLPALSQTPDELTSANGAAGIIEGAGIILGPLIAAAILTQAGPAMVIGVFAIVVLGGAALVAPIRLQPPSVSIQEPEPAEPNATAPGPEGLLPGLRVVLTDKDARLVVGLMSARMLMIGAADVLFVLMAIELLRMGEPGVGILNAALGAGMVAGGATAFVLVGRGRLASIAAAGACLWGLALGIAGWLATPIPAIALIVVGGAGLAIVDVAGRTILQRSVRDSVLAGVFGIQEGLAMVALALGSLLVPALAVLLGLTGAILAVAAVLPLIVAIIWSHLIGLDARTPVPAHAIALLRRVALFEPLPPPGLEAIARRVTWRSVDPGTVLIREGEIGDRFYVLASGAVKVEREGRHLRELTRPGDGFGEIALLRSVPRTATVTATAASVLMVVDRQAFLAAVTGNPNVSSRADTIVDTATM